MSLDTAGPAAVADFVEREKLRELPVLVGDRNAARALDLKSLPTTIAVDAGDTIRARLEGAVKAADLEAEKGTKAAEKK